jgi:hypothetical protein
MTGEVVVTGNAAGTGAPRRPGGDGGGDDRTGRDRSGG